MAKVKNRRLDLRWRTSFNLELAEIHRAFTPDGVRFRIELIDDDNWKASVRDREGLRPIYIGRHLERAKRACEIFDVFNAQYQARQPRAT